MDWHIFAKGDINCPVKKNCKYNKDCKSCEDYDLYNPIVDDTNIENKIIFRSDKMHGREGSEEKEEEVYTRPPLGVIPKKVWYLERMKEFQEAINRYVNAGLVVPIWWVEEYNSIVELYYKK